MRQPVIFVKPDTMRSALTPWAAALCGLAALFGIPGIFLFFSRDYTQYLLQDMAISGITNPASMQTWLFINRCVTVLACAGPAVMASGLFLSRRGNPVRGLNMLSGAAHGLLWAQLISGITAAAIFIFRFIRYILICLGDPSGVISIYSMLISEALMVAQAGFLFVMIRRFLNACIDSATSIAYTLATSKLDTRSIPGLASTGFLVLSIVCMCLAVNRMFTVTAVINVVKSYYKLLVATHPGIILESICLVLGSAANYLIFLILRRYKRKTEQALFQSKKS